MFQYVQHDQNEKLFFDTNHYIIQKYHKVFFTNLHKDIVFVFCQIFTALEKTWMRPAEEI